MGIEPGEEDDVVVAASNMSSEVSYDKTRDYAVHLSGFKFERPSEQFRWEQIAMEESEKSLEATRLSHKKKQSRIDKSKNEDDGNPSFEFDEMLGSDFDPSLLSA